MKYEVGVGGSGFRGRGSGLTIRNIVKQALRQGAWIRGVCFRVHRKRLRILGSLSNLANVPKCVDDLYRKNCTPQMAKIALTIAQIRSAFKTGPMEAPSACIILRRSFRRPTSFIALNALTTLRLDSPASFAIMASQEKNMTIRSNTLQASEKKGDHRFANLRIALSLHFDGDSSAFSHSITRYT